ncbi:hypothetical protein D030_1377A, partial [Vibrio parahaemolyticus AQ3810]
MKAVVFAFQESGYGSVLL